MKIKGLDDREYTWSLVKHERGNCSSGHLRARKLLKELYPFDIVYEEVTLPGSQIGKLGVLKADFYIHSRRLMIEVQGIQHEQYNSFFYPTKLDFIKAKSRDKNKKAWCETNEIELIILLDSQSDAEWKKILK